MNRIYRPFEGWDVRWAFFPDYLLKIGTPSKVPLWEFWMRSLVLSPLVAAILGGVAWNLILDVYHHPWLVFMILLHLWFVAIIAGGVLKVIDKKLENEDSELRAFIYFE